VPEYLRYVRVLAERAGAAQPARPALRRHLVHLLLGARPAGQGWRGAFDREITASRQVIAALPDLPAHVGVALPCHHLYRALAFSEYGGRGQTPIFPSTEDVAQVRRAGRQILAWPHFVMDDDAYRAPAWGIVHSEVRYLQALLRSLRAVGSTA